MSGEQEAARVAGRAAEHIVAKAVERAGVREAETVVARAGEDVVARAAAGAEHELLDAADRAALREYTGPAYREINAYNRGVPMAADEAARLEERSAAVSRALDKLPPHEGLVHRGGDFSEEVLARYRPGEVVTEDAFTSTSLKRGFRGNTRFEVYSSEGRYIAPYAEPRFRHQEEVLFDRGTRFRVLAHDVVDGKHFVILREVT